MQRKEILPTEIGVEDAMVVVVAVAKEGLRELSITGVDTAKLTVMEIKLDVFMKAVNIKYLIQFYH